MTEIIKRPQCATDPKEEFEDNEHLDFLITHEENSDTCTLHVRANGRGISDFQLTKTQLESLQRTIYELLKIW